MQGLAAPVQHVTPVQYVTIRWLGQQDYLYCWQAMQTFTEARQAHTVDELWIVEHFSVFTQGVSARIADIIADDHTIPILTTNRGGKTTYHGPGQLIIYTLLDLKRKKLSVRHLVTLLETSVLTLLNSFNVLAHTKANAPGVYITTTSCPSGTPDSHLMRQEQESKKICSIGLRVHRGCTYHGIALNVCMDLMPFSKIIPCGSPLLKMTQLTELGIVQETTAIANMLVNDLLTQLNYIAIEHKQTYPE